MASPAPLIASVVLATLAVGPFIEAQAPTRITVQASSRIRAEGWNWHDMGAEGRYAYGTALNRLGFSQDRRPVGWRLEVNVPVMLALPQDAILAAPAGQLGMGAAYAGANAGREHVARVVLRQAWAVWSAPRWSLRAGRFEFSDGLERSPASPALVTIKTTRIGQRLVGPFTFTQVQRSLDGVLATWRPGPSTFTAVVARPTSGVFTVVEAGHTLAIDLGYVAWSRGFTRPDGIEADVRAFGTWYDDRRGAVPSDNRQASLRAAAPRNISVSTVGGHAAAVIPHGGRTWDLLAWGLVQAGSWSTLDHRAGALAVEGGLQWPSAPWAPWLRAGVYRGSGDDDPSDDRHGTFHQLLPTPRPYARFPFFNGMNTSEAFTYLLLRPTRTVTARLSAHRIRLSSAADAWYLGGGAFDKRSFGFSLRPSSGETALGALWDASVEWRPHRRLTLEVFGAANTGNAVAERIPGGHDRARMGYVEMSLTR